MRNWLDSHFTPLRFASLRHYRRFAKPRPIARGERLCIDKGEGATALGQLLQSWRHNNPHVSIFPTSHLLLSVYIDTWRTADLSDRLCLGSCRHPSTLLALQSGPPVLTLPCPALPPPYHQRQPNTNNDLTPMGNAPKTRASTHLLPCVHVHVCQVRVPEIGMLFEMAHPPMEKLGAPTHDTSQKS